MRIIAGEKKGFILKIPHGHRTRPTLARVRESLFSILSGSVIDANVLDLYAGCGALGLEALSRGSTHCTFVDHARGAVACIHDNVRKLGYDPCTTVCTDDVLRWLRRDHTGTAPFDLVFVDPPYDTGQSARALEAMESHLPLSDSPLIVLQCSTRENVPDECGKLELARSQRYGDTAIHIYRTAQMTDARTMPERDQEGRNAQD